jgi:hypothetical protein
MNVYIAKLGFVVPDSPSIQCINPLPPSRTQVHSAPQSSIPAVLQSSTGPPRRPAPGSQLPPPLLPPAPAPDAPAPATGFARPSPPLLTGDWICSRITASSRGAPVLHPGSRLLVPSSLPRFFPLLRLPTPLLRRLDLRGLLRPCSPATRSTRHSPVTASSRRPAPGPPRWRRPAPARRLPSRLLRP